MEVYQNCQRGKDKITFFPYMGGKFFMLDTILNLIPPHRCYVEPFGGSAKVLLNKQPSEVEVYNDINGDIVNLFKIVKERYDEFMKELEWILYSREIHNEFYKKWMKREWKDDLERAVVVYYCLYSNMNGGIYKASFSSSKSKNYAERFFNSLSKLKQIYERLKNVIIENLDFRKIIQTYDSKDTFFYIDPPYVVDTNYYSNDFTIEDHKELLDMVNKIEGKVMISGYESDLYNQALKEWYKIEKDAIKHSAISLNNKPRVKEVMWMNYNGIFQFNNGVKNAGIKVEQTTI
jgi:DNA adenine methylase